MAHQLDPALKALVFQLVDITSLSMHWFQMSTCNPLQRGVTKLEFDAVLEVRRCKLNPGLKAPGFKSSTYSEEKRAFNLKPGF